MQQSLSLRLEHRLGLYQAVRLSHFLNMPSLLIDQVMQNVVDNPDKVEELLARQLDYTRNITSSAKAVYGNLADLPHGISRGREGLIMTPSGGKLVDLVQEEINLEVFPDATYQGKDNEKPHVMYSQHLVNIPRMRLEAVPLEFRKARRLLKILSSLREWKNSTLRDMYLLIGDKQRDFCATLDPNLLNAYSQEDVAKATNLSISSVSRLLKGKYVLVKSASGEEQIHLVRNLMPTIEKLRRYHTIKQINDILSTENGEQAFSDQRISDKIPNAARRTVTKYRVEARVPLYHERRKSLSLNPEKKYTVPYFVSELSE